MRAPISVRRLLAAGLAVSLAACTGTTPATSTGPGGGVDPNAPLGAAEPVTEAEAVAELPPFPDEPFRKEPPKAGPDRAFKLPPVKTFTIGPAVQVYLIEDHDLPVVSLDLNLAGGTMNDPPGKAGLADLCMYMLTEGTQRLDKIAYSEALADIASTVSTYAGEDRQGLSMNSLKRNLPATFALFAETITSPGFREADFDRMMKRTLETLKQTKASPASVSGRVRDGVLYGANHPLGRVYTETTLGAIKLADCKRYHAAYVKPRAARLFVTGDVTEAEVKAAFEPLFATWKGAPKKSASMPRPKPPAGKVFFVHIPGAAQSSISLLHLGPPRTSPHFFSNTLMAQLLGGGFASRINMNLREDKGYSYGARGGFNYNRFFGSFSAASSVRTDATVQSIIEIYDEVEGLVAGKRPPTDAELEREKNDAILGLPASFATGSSTLGMYRGLVYFGLPLDYYNTYVGKVQEVTLEAVADAARRELTPATAHILVVGDGDAPQIVNVPGGTVDDMKSPDNAPDKKANPPMLGKDGKQLTLRQALAELLASGKIGKGALVELDADGKRVGR